MSDRKLVVFKVSASAGIRLEMNLDTQEARAAKRVNALLEARADVAAGGYPMEVYEVTYRRIAVVQAAPRQPIEVVVHFDDEQEA